MNILFLTLMEINNFSQTGIYPDLINEFAENGHDIYVVSPCEKKNRSRYKLINEKGHIHLVSALIPDYYGVSLVKKGISSLAIGRKYLEAINKAIPLVRFDMVLYSTPPITFCNVIEKIKKRDHAFSYLLLKDIWPQGPIDIGALSEKGIKGFIVNYFRAKERRLYRISDFIGCMSQKNCEYLVRIYGIENSKVEICPNSIKVREIPAIDKNEVREKNGFPVDKTIFVYGGNLGMAQGIDFIISCLEENEKSTDSYILIIGSGTEYEHLKKWFNTNKPINSKLLDHLPSEEYKQIMSACDVGLVFLDYRFTIPNFPSRILSYMEAKMPVLLATDINTDIGEIAVNGEFGFWCKSNDVKSFVLYMNKLTDEDRRKKMGENAFKYLCNYYSITTTYKTIMHHM